MIETRSRLKAIWHILWGRQVVFTGRLHLIRPSPLYPEARATPGIFILQGPENIIKNCYFHALEGGEND